MSQAVIHLLKTLGLFVLAAACAAGALLLGGCAPSNLADVIRAAATDDATLCARVTTVYGTATLMRTNIHGGDVTCDTLGVKSTTNISVPITVTPTISVAPPVPAKP